ncbi:MAG: hypothetical protein V3W41_10630 [Planctomycetota bacterium]
MRFGDYLLSRGTVTLKDLVSALNAQRLEQEPLGKIALAQGKLNIKQVFLVLNAQASDREIARSDTQGYLFGDICIEFGFFNDQELIDLLRLQRMSRPQIGEILVNKGALSREQLQEFLREYAVYKKARKGADMALGRSG